MDGHIQEDRERGIIYAPTGYEPKDGALGVELRSNQKFIYSRRYRKWEALKEKSVELSRARSR